MRKPVLRKRTIGLLQFVILLLVVLSSTAIAVYALTILWSAQVGVTVVDTVGLSVYSDQACTSPVSSIDFGEQKKGAATDKTLYVKNTGSADIKLDWSSNAPTTILSADDFVYYNNGAWANIKGYTLKAGEVLTAKYQIYILPTAAAGSKSWTLSIGAS